MGFNPELDPLDKGWQALMSRQCIENGGLLGVGLRTGGNYEDLAASHTDFIFATVCEKFGFVGGVDPRVVIGRRILFGDVRGVVGIKAVHLTTREERKTMPKTSSLYIDIGASDKKEAYKKAPLIYEA